MKRRFLMFLFALAMTALIPLSALAASPPAKISPPQNFAAGDYMGVSAVCTLSAPEDLRKLIAQTEEERGYYMLIMAQVDFKTDGGSWHYTPEWDDKATYSKYVLYFYNSLTGGDNQRFLGAQDLYFREMFPEESNIPVQDGFNSWDWYKSHSMTLRARFAITFGDNLVFSDWSEEYTMSHGSKMDYQKIMNENAPTLVSSKIETRGPDNVPWVVLQLTQHPAPVQKLNAAANNTMWTEIWLRKMGDADFKKVGQAPFCDERISLDIGAYFPENLPNYGAQAYDVKVRYTIDERDYHQSGVTEMNWLYSPFSNTLSYGMPAWSAASSWAEGDLQKADTLGLIPASLKNADLTRPITREEFTEVTLILYEKSTGQKTTPFSPNPFTDTNNPEILKAYNVGIAKGMSATTYAPKELITREQVAAILLRAIKIMAPEGDYSSAGAPTFADQKDISDWALESVLVISKLGIIRGAEGKFMPKAVTTAQQAAGYANTTREQAILMSLRTYEVIK